MSDHLCYLRDSSEYIHGTVATPPPDLCGTWKVPAWSPDNVSDAGFRDISYVHHFLADLRISAKEEEAQPERVCRLLRMRRCHVFAACSCADA